MNSTGPRSNSTSIGNTTVTANSIVSPMGPALAAFFSALGFSIVAIAAVGNLAILVAFVAVRKLRTHVNYFLASLALSDFVLAVFYLPLEVEYHTRKMFIHSKGMCDFMYILFFLTITSSSLNLLGVSAYRFLTIQLPFRSSSITKPHVRMVILAIWVYSTLVAFLPLMGWRPMETIVTKTDCYYMYSREYAIFVMAVNWLCPALLGFFLYFMMFRVARSQARKIARIRGRHQRRRGPLFKGTKTLLKITVIYFICWFPYVIEVLLVACKLVRSNQIVHYFMVYLCYANSAVNPILYAGLCADIREVFRAFVINRAIRCFTKRHRRKADAGKSHRSTGRTTALSASRLCSSGRPPPTDV